MKTIIWALIYTAALVYCALFITIAYGTLILKKSVTKSNESFWDVFYGSK